MVRRRADEVRAGLREANLGNLRRHLFAHQLAAFAGLRALRHLDRNLIGVHQIFRIDAEATRCHLANPRTEPALADVVGVERVNAGVLFSLFPHFCPVFAVRLRGNVVPPTSFAALTGVAKRVEFIERCGNRHVRRTGQRAVAHRGTTEVAANDVDARLNLLLRDGASHLDFEQVAKHRRHAVVDEVRELHELRPDFVGGIGDFIFERCRVRRLAAAHHGVGVSFQHRIPQRHPHFGLVGVIVLVAAERAHIHGPVETPFHVFDEVRKREATDARGEVAEELHEFRAEADCLEQHRPAIAFDRRDPHLRDNLLERIFERLEQILQGFARG